MNNQERNWLNLFGKYTPETTTWHVLSTSYSPELEVIRSHKFMRAFKTNSDRSIVYHQNTYYLPDNQIQEKNWQINQQECNLADGVFHPEAETMRAIGFGNDTSIWVSKKIKIDKMFGSEVFFQQEDWRHSIIPVYQEGNLDKIIIIKENQQNFPTQVDAESIEDLSGKWQLTQTETKPDLQTSLKKLSQQEIQLDSLVESNQNWFLPEKVFVSLPQTITEGQEFKLLVGRQITPNLYKQITSQYDATGNLSNLISEVYELED
ncbi:MAG: DUF3598 family protein [Xenococcaceae cyanobacterium MO_167.B27]|nr:DUF3598 family protein [Xenococcaceae cyanobacterium MO_167.B27]